MYPVVEKVNKIPKIRNADKSKRCFLKSINEGTNKKHDNPISLIGGVPMFISFFFVYLIFINKLAYIKESIIILIASL